MTITSITIENFKGIGDAVTIPIRPITLLFGKNSSGKSTVLQALHYINKYIQYMDGRARSEKWAAEPDYVDPSIDIGDFHSLVHRHELNRTIRIRIEFDSPFTPSSSWIEMTVSKEGFSFTDSEKPNTSYYEYGIESIIWHGLHALRNIRYLGPLREVPPRNYHSQMPPNESLWTKGLEAWNTLARNPKLIPKINHYMRDVLKLGYRFTLPPDIISLDRDGKIVANLRKICASEYIEVKKLKEQVLEPIEQLPHYSGEILLRDENHNIDVSPLDVGSGISQVIPVLVGTLHVQPQTNSSYGQPRKFFAVEQPELHLHPAAQVALGDVFIDGIQNTDRTFLIETHSEHLLLRIMRRMRETFEDRIEENRFPVTPDDIAVLFVEWHDSRTIIREMPVNERGELVKAWPGGFFEEDIEEVFA